MKINIGRTLTITDIANMCGGTLWCVGGVTNKEMPFNMVCTDSRETGEDTLFVAFGGARVDGHDFIGAALTSGSPCVLCERIPEQINDKQYVAVVVEDSIKAIGELAKAYDRNISHTKIAVTGSVGKTTTKEFIAAVLSNKYRVHKTEGNFNSNIGMPLSILATKHDTEVSVLEMGMSGAGEIEYLSKIAEPDIAIITNIGSSHLENLGTRENICKAKLEIISGLKKGGTLIVNGDEPLLSEYSNPDFSTITVGIDNPMSTFRAQNIRYNAFSTIFDVVYGRNIYRDIIIPTMGKHNVYAALFAYAAAVRSSLDDAAIAKGLLNFKPVGMRQNIYPLGGITVIEDCYNASPESMKAAISVMADLSRGKGGARMTALLGDMYELGSESELLHEEVGKAFVKNGGKLLFTFGKNANTYARGAVLHGLFGENIYRNEDTKAPEISGEMLLHSLKKNDILLVKASRGAAAERILKYLKDNEERLCSM